VGRSAAACRSHVGYGARVPSPLVSVVVPCHDRAHVIARAVRSALRQTVDDLEVLVVDDGSTDGTEGAVAALADPRVRFIRRDQQGGGSAARNTGIASSTGRYIAFLDSDDEWRPEKLERQLPYLADQPALGVCGFVRVQRGSRRTGVPGAANVPDGEGLLLELRGGPMTSSVFVVERAELDRCGVRFDETLPALQDLDFALQLAQQGLPMVGPTEALVLKHRDPDGAHVFNPTSQIRARRLVLAKYDSELRGRPEAWRIQRRNLAGAELRVGNGGAAAAEIQKMVDDGCAGRREVLLGHLARRWRTPALWFEWFCRQLDGNATSKVRLRIADVRAGRFRTHTRGTD
jgi:glycosyltransferase involved in cell wall biosynthesis